MINYSLLKYIKPCKVIALVKVYNNFQMTSKHIGGYIISLSDVLGCGSFGKVYKGIKTSTKQEVAIKIITKSLIDSNPYLKASLNNQIKIFQTVSSQNILGFMDVMESPNNYYIVSQLCDRDLSQIIKAKPCMPQKEAIEIIRQICCGLLALVREGISHRDLKPANIMVQGKTYKLGDFGFSKQLNYVYMPQSGQATGMMETVVGTPLYMSLQILKAHQYTSKCDIWALGLIFFEMLHGETPWKGNSQYELVRNIEKKPLTISRKDLKPETIDFLKKCLQLQQKDRISWNELFVHPMFDNYFLAMADQNKEYQNQMKAIMTKLRFYFNLNKNQLQLYLSKYGFMSKDEDLNFEQYFEFLRAVNPTISEQEAKYIFKKTDADNSGTISLDEILRMLKIYGIDLQEDNSLVKTHSKDSSQKQIKQQTAQQLTDAEISDFKTRAAQRLKEVFIKLHKIIIRNNLSLKKVFHDFDKQKKGNLNYLEFKVMLQKMCKDISDQQAMMAFQIIDEDGSKSLQYEEISKHYKLINQIN